MKKHTKKLIKSIKIPYKNTTKRVVDVEAPKNMILEAIWASILGALKGLGRAWRRHGPNIERLQADSSSQKP